MLAAIDIGTNSVLLLIAYRLADGSYRAEHERCIITRLGRDIDRTGLLDQEAVDCTLDALRQFSSTLDNLGVSPDQRAAVGTSVLRSTTNAEAFLVHAQAVLKCPVEVISGRREAELVLAGVRTAFGDLPPRTVLFDAGGGSTELIRGTETASLDIGAVRLTEKYLHSDPPGPEEIEAARQHVKSRLDQLSPSFTAAEHIIGIAGTVTTLAAIKIGLEVYDTERVNGSWLTLGSVEEQIQRLSRLPLDARKEIVGLDPARADIIVAGAIIVGAVLQHFGLIQLRVCDRGVRWGLLSQMGFRTDT